VVLPKNAPHIETRTTISVRPAAASARPVAMNLTSQLN
jgi:hypothetical protein